MRSGMISRCLGFLCESKRVSHSQYQVIRFSLIRKLLAYVKRETHFTLGNQVLSRRMGWPMGGSYSEPGTLADLQHEVFLLYEKHLPKKQRGLKKAKDCGWHLDGFSVESLSSS